MKNNEFQCNVDHYTKFRPSYPFDFVKYLSELTSSNQVVLDCGSGSGQNSLLLPKFFKKVIVLDILPDLLKKIPDLKNIYKICAAAEQLPLTSNSIDLICVAQALHWFNLENFYKEVHRVLRKNGTIAAWCYNKFITNDPNLDDIILKIHKLLEHPAIITPMSRYVHSEYKTIYFPFQKIATQNYSMKANFDLSFTINYIETYPSIIAYRKKIGNKDVDDLYQKLEEKWQNPLTKRAIYWPLNLLLGKIC